METNKSEKQGLSTFQIILFTFSAVFVLDSLGLPITYGWQSIIWWVILGILFFLPYGLITAELSTTYGNEGGIYTWTKRAYGDKMAARSNYYYWVNVAFWMPSVYLVLGDTLMIAIANVSPELANAMQQTWWIWISVVIAIGATWLTVGVNLLPLEKASWVPSISSIIKLSLVFILVVSLFVFIGKGNSSQTNIEQNSFAPDFGGSIGIIGIIVYNMCGFELGTNIEIKDVKKTMAKAIGVGGLTIIVSYIIASIPILFMVDANSQTFQDNYTASIVMALQAVCPDWFVIIAAGLLALTLFGNMCTWTLGGNGAIVEAAENKEFIASFAWKNEYNSPIMPALFTGIISTVTVIIAGILTMIDPSGNAWFIMFSFSLVIFFIPYMIIFYGYIKLRKQNPDLKDDAFGIKNPYIAQGLGWLVLIVVSIATFAQLFEVNIGSTITITPTEGMFGWIGILVTIIGLIIVILIGEFLINKAIKDQLNSQNLTPDKIIKEANENTKQEEFPTPNTEIKEKITIATTNSINSSLVIKNLRRIIIFSP